MPVETLACQPSQITAGDTARFTVSDSDYPATDWTLAFTIRCGTSLLTVAGVADGDDFTIVFTATQTALLTPGTYAAMAVYTEIAVTAEKATVQKPAIRVLPNLANSTVGPRRAAYNTARAALDAKIAGDQSFSFNGQSATSYALGDLQKMVDRMLIDALEEDRRLGIGAAGGLVRIQTRL